MIRPMLSRCGTALLTVLALAVVPDTAAQEVEAMRRFEKGTELLAAGEYVSAIDTLHSALDLGYVSVAAYYNLGTAHYRMDDLGRAVLYFERARRLDPSNRSIVHNLEIVRSRVVDRFSRLPVPIWTRMWRRATSLVGAWGYFAVGATAWLVLCVLVATRIRRGRAQPWLRRSAWLAAGFAILFLGAAFSASVRSPWGEHAVIVDETVTLYATPDAAESVLVLHEGVTVERLAVSGNQARVRLENGIIGWLDTASLSDI